MLYGVRINPTAQSQPATHVRRFKVLNALNTARIHSFCVMFARLSELRSVIQGSIPELILSQNCNTVYVHMGPICNGCWVWNSWSVVAHFTRDGVNNTRNFHLWDRDNPHGTVESNYQHLFAVNVWFGVIGDKLIGHFTATSGRWYLRQLFANELPALSQNVPLPARRQMC